MSDRERRRRNKIRNQNQLPVTSVTEISTVSSQSGDQLPVTSVTEISTVSSQSGTFHQGNVRLFPHWSVGKQCPCNCLVAMCQNVITPCHLWTAADIDLILLCGDQLYRDTVPVQEQSRYLAVDELPQSLEVSGCRFLVTLLPLLIGTYNATGNSGVFYTLSEALSMALEHDQSCFLTIKGYTMCILQTVHSSGFFVFDSHSRDSMGICSIDGNAVSLHVSNLHMLNNQLHKLFVSLSVDSNEQFEIVPVCVSKAGVPSISHMQTSSITIAVPASYQALSRETQNKLGIGTPLISPADTLVQRETPFRFEAPTSKLHMSPPHTPVQRRNPFRFHSSPTSKPRMSPVHTPVQRRNPFRFHSPPTSKLRMSPAHTPVQRRNPFRFHSPPTSKLRMSPAHTPVQRRKMFTFNSPPMTTPERCFRQKKERDRKRPYYTTGTMTPRTKEHKKTRKGRSKSQCCLDPDNLAKRVIDKFQKDIRTSPAYVCTCCHRLLYKKGVVGFTASKRNKIQVALRMCITSHISMKGKEWICHTCDRTLSRGKIPAQAVWNNLKVCDVPPELANLSTLEARLLATRYPFMKLLALPRGRQSGIKGSVVNVPVSASQVCQALPRTLNSAGIVPLTLKRKMVYRSHTSHQNIRPAAVRTALGVLQKSNPFYSATTVNKEWEADCRQEDEDVWIGLTANDTESTDADQRTDTVDTDQRTDTVDVDQMTNTVDADQRTNTVDADQMTNTVDADQMTDTVDADQMTNTVDADQMTDTVDADQMTDTVDADQMTDTVDADQMTDTVDADQMTDTVDADQMTDTVDADQMTDTQNADQRIDSRDVDQSETIQEDISQLRGVVFDTCLQEADPALVDDQSFSIAPGEGQRPVPIMTDDCCEERAFPQLFPTGKFGVTTNRVVPLSAKKYFNARVLNKDPRFANNIEYLFFAQFVTEQKQVYDSLSIALRKGRSGSSHPMTASILKDPQRLKKIIFKDEAYRFLQPIRGTPPYWQRIMYDLLAAIKQLGIFTWFLTLSAADLKWTDTIQSIAMQYGVTLSDEKVESMTWDEKCKWLRENPVTAARHFDFKLTKLFQDVIKNKELQPLGPVSNFFYRIEFQQRGSPHAHCVIFVDKGPQLSTHSDQEVIAFIDKYTTCALPDDDEMRELVMLQKHAHSKSCRKTGMNCRFKFPRPPSTETIIAKWEDQPDLMPREMACDIMKHVREIMQDGASELLTMEELLSKAGMSHDAYHQALRQAPKSKTVVLQRKPQECNINQYNKVILQAWKANTDFQFVVDPYSCIHYIVSYVTKDEREMGQVLKAAAEELGDPDTKEKMKRCAKQFLQMREVSAQESVYRLLGLPLHKATFTSVFLSTDFKENRVALMKPRRVIEQMDDDDEDVFTKNIIDRYQCRPNEMENICLAEFARSYELYGGTKSESIDSGQDDSDREKQQMSQKRPIILLQNGMGKIRKRTKPAIVRYHSFSKTKQPEKHYHSLLMLFIPWREEEHDLLSGKETYAESYVDFEETIASTRTLLESHSEEIDNAVEKYEENGPPVHAWDTLAPQVEQERDEQSQDIPQEDAEHLLTQPPEEKSRKSATGTPSQASHSDVVISSEKRKGIATDDEFRAQVRSLNEVQRGAFQYVLKWCHRSLKMRKHGKKPEPFHLFLTGGAGTGKSHVIKTVYQLLMKQLRSHGDNPDDVPVLLTAPTGTAAFQIGGTTLHAAFLLPLGQTKSYQKLTDDKRNSLRSRYANVEVLIIDEISMVGTETFLLLHRRLCEIKGTDKPFGGLSVLAIGDLYQLPPVGQSQIFELPRDPIDQFQGSLWEEHFEIVQLCEIMRQKDDVDFAQLLNRIRTAEVTEADIALLETRIVSPDSEDYPMDALHVFSTNEAVLKHNNTKLGTLGTDIKQIMAKDVIPDSVRDYNPNADERYTGGLPTTLSVAIGARVMLIRNLDVADGLVNGSQGTVVGIGETNGTVNKIMIKFDSELVGTKAKQQMCDIPDAVTIMHFEVKFTISKKGGEEIKRCQFPLRLAWAVTIHKVQGLTLNTIVVSFHKIFQSGQAYVALSRATSIAGLYLLDLDPKKIFTNKKVEKQMKHMLTNKKLDLANVTVSVENTFQLALLNVRSLKRHHIDVLHDPALSSVDIIALTETWLKSHDGGAELSLSGYTLFRADRCDASKVVGGGVAAYVRSSHNCESQVFSKNGIQVLWITCRNCQDSASTMRMIILYRAPDVNKNELLSVLDDILTMCAEQSAIPTFIVGDFNIDLLQEGRFINALSQNGFEQLVTEPSHISGSLLDHVYVRSLDSTSCCSNIDCYYSDHDIVKVAIHK